MDYTAMDFDISKPSKMGMKLYQDMLVVALYYYMPPRRLDYAPMEIIFTRDDDKEKKNYLLVLNKNKKYFIFNDYKTFKHHGKQEFLIDKKLNKIIEDWLKMRDSRRKCWTAIPVEHERKCLIFKWFRKIDYDCIFFIRK